MRYMPQEWILTFDYEGGKVKTVVVARTDAGARAFAPAGATNVKTRQKRQRTAAKAGE